MRWIVAFLACIGLAQAQIIQHQIYDDGYAHVPLQFGFPLHGRIFTDSYMFSNGVVGFGSVNNHWCCTGHDLTTARGYQFNYSILGLQTDLINYGSGRFLTEGTTQYQRYMWENISEFGAPQNLNTFGIEIRPSGYIGIHHQNINISSWRPVTVGITGDTTAGEYTQFYHGAGYVSNTPVSFITQTTGDMCLIDPLSSPTCSGYQQAYLTQQCSINALYSSFCAGYEQAYFNQQCSLNPLYNRNCAGYEQAYALANVTPTTTAPTAPVVQISNTGTISVETPIIADRTVNDVIVTNLQTAARAETVAQPASSSPANASSPVSQARQETKKEERKEDRKEDKKEDKKEERKEQKRETRQMAKIEPSTVGSAPEIRSVELPKGVDIIDHSFMKMIANVKPIRDNPRMFIHSDRIHRELVDGQRRR